MLILYTGTKCPKCPDARKNVREVAKELGLIEGKDFVEKLIDGEELQEGMMELEGEKFLGVKGIENVKDMSVMIGEDFSIEALMNQIASTPSIVINEEAVFVGRAPSKEELLKALKR